MPISPPDEALKDVLRALRAENPTLGTAKLQAQLLIAHPEWSVSEKRVKRLLAAENLLIAPPPRKNKTKHTQNNEIEVYPSSKTIEGLDVSRWTKKVKVVDFGPSKGKGLVATEDIAKDEDIWKEEPFAIAPGWEFFDFQQLGHACSYCTTPFNSSTLPRSLPCSSASIPSLAGSCGARFCGRLCLSRAQRHFHPLLCPALNPACLPLLSYVRQVPWRAPYAAAQCIARVLLASEQGHKKELEEDMRFLDALANMSFEDRWKPRIDEGRELNRRPFEDAYALTLQAFLEPEKAEHKKILSKVLRRSIPENIKSKFLEKENYFRLVSAMTFNIETHGGLYVLHSHLNHSCDPNVKAIHLEQRTALNRMTIRAVTDIRAGEELFITYVNPNLSYKERRQEVSAWAFGKCMCSKCVREEAADPERQEEKQGEGNAEDDVQGNGANERGGNALQGLEEELREGLGLI